VEDDRLHLLLDGIASIFQLAQMALSARQRLAAFIAKSAPPRRWTTTTSHAGDSAWRILPAFDHPDEPRACLVTGTGLTHKKSAATRQAMHVNRTRRCRTA
jgi:hypothetical protein